MLRIIFDNHLQPLKINIMKRLATILLILVVICSCKKSEPKKELSEKEKQESFYKIAEVELLFQKEKIVLLSEIKRVPYDTLYLILRDYYSKTFYSSYLPDSSRLVCENAINSISKNYHVSKPRVASFIFSFKYEMLSKEDIISREHEQELSDPRY